MFTNPPTAAATVGIDDDVRNTNKEIEEFQIKHVAVIFRKRKPIRAIRWWSLIAVVELVAAHDTSKAIVERQRVGDRLLVVSRILES